MSADGQRPGGDGAPGTGPEGNGAKGNGPLPSRLPAAGARRGGPPWMNVGLPAEKSMNFGPSARRLVGRLRQYRLQLAAIITLSVLSVTMSVIGPRVLGRATDIIFAGYIGRQLPVDTSLAATVARLRANGDDNRANLLEKVNAVPGQGVDFHQLGRVLLLALVLFAGASVLMWLQAYMLTGVTQATVRELRAEAEDKLGRLPLSYFDGQPRGELLSRVTNDIDNISQTLQQTISQVLTSVLTVIGVLIMMFSISWQLALIALVAVPLTIAVTRQIAKRSQPLFIAQWQHTGALNADVEEAFTGHELVKVFGRHREVEETFGAKNEQLYGASFGAQFVSGTIMPATMFIGNLSYVAIAVAGGLRVASGTMSLGDVQAFIQYSRQFTQPLTQIASMMNTLQSGVASAERVFDLLDADEQSPDPEPAVDLHDARGRVEFRDVTFRYREDRPLIEHLSLVAEPGQTVAIVGPTGAGKTTLVNLIMRFYELDGGSILLDGVDIRTMRRADLRAEIGMVLQDAWLFGGTIRENIRYGRPDATDDEVLAAAQATLVDRFVHSLPDGYDTMIDEEGAGISAGEKQLITIARAFLAAPSLLILDEATSSVDTRTEVLVQRAMATLREGRTSFVIAHRLSTIRDADLILVMEHGRIVEQGTSAELLAVNGAYRRLYEAQFAQAVADHDAEATGADGAAGAVPAGRGS